MTQAEISPHDPAAPCPADIPAGHIGLVDLPGSNRQVWWTGRVAIGLRYERHDGPEAPTAAEFRIHDLLQPNEEPPVPDRTQPDTSARQGM
jgi:hypothetical protein